MQKNQANLKKDVENRVELTQLVEKMTTSGRPVLDEKLIKPLKRICRESDDYVRHVFHMLVTRLKKKHAEIRLSAFQICSELFARSHCFRDLFLSEVQHLLKLLLDIDPKYPLPPPKCAAAELQRQVKQALKNWNETFGQTYKKLSLCYNYLQKSKQINFVDVQTTTVQQLVENERQRRLEAFNLQRLNRIAKEIEDVSLEINASIAEAESCISLLLESVGVFDSDDFCSDRWTSNDVAASSNDESFDAGATGGCSHDSGTHVSDTDPSSSLEGEVEVEKLPSRGVDSNDIKKAADDDPIGLEERTSTMEGKYDASSYGYASSSGEHTTDVSRQHGLHAFGAGLQINVTKTNVTIQATTDNFEVIQNMEDQRSLLSNRFLPTVKKWLQALTKLGASQDNLKTALQMKSAVESTLDRIHKLNVSDNRVRSAAASRDNQSDDSSGDEDFEEVMEKDGYEAHVPLHVLHEARCCSPPLPSMFSSNTSWPVKDHSLADPTVSSGAFSMKSSSSSGVSQFDEECQPSTSGQQSVTNEQKTQLLSRAPIVSYASDLCSWEDKVDAPLINRNNPDSHWWSKQSDDVVDILALHASKSRVIDFSGTFEPVRWKCRAPRGDGTLCERMDRYKCPFHGKIVARNKKGLVENSSNEKPSTSGNSANTVSASTSTASTSISGDSAADRSVMNDWDDPELQADIKAATGIDLSRKGRKKGRQRKPKLENGLTDITLERKDSCRKRLEEKVFSRSAMKRVASTMNHLEAKRHENTFANNFNYAFRR